MATTVEAIVNWVTAPTRYTRRERKKSGRRIARGAAATGIRATGATEGNPGSFTGGRIPYNLAELTAWGALGETTAWAAPNNVVLGDGTLAHWNGSAWAAGAAT